VLIIEVAKKGALARSSLTMAIMVLVGAAGYSLSSILNGYYLVGTYGFLVVPCLLAALWSLWSLRRLVRCAFARTPLIFAADGQLNYVAPGHATLRISDIGCYAIKGKTLPRLYFYSATGLELRRYPLFLSPSSQVEVADGLAALGLNACREPSSLE
jgi:hypothetical protein